MPLPNFNLTATIEGDPSPFYKCTGNRFFIKNDFSITQPNGRAFLYKMDQFIDLFNIEHNMIEVKIRIGSVTYQLQKI